MPEEIEKFMKIKIIKKILASLIAATTIMGTISSVVGANPKKCLCNCQNIYDLNEFDEDEQVDDESNEEESFRKTEEREKGENEISQFVFLLKKPIWNEWGGDNFFKICLNFSYNDLLGECPLKQKIRITDRLIRFLCTDEDKEWVAEIFLNFSSYDFFKEYPLDQKLGITDALIECLGQDAAKEDVAEAFANLSRNDFFKDYSVQQKLKIAKTLLVCLSKKEIDRDVIEPLKQFLESPEILEKLDQSEKTKCLDIIKSLQV